ncbi:aspartyl-phosphate phosphatase Spo0E family protein [Bacillus sp. DJP31]|uniref:aspartyl-phosphate phosphatase Spo0E family protein n=1 Tax=Bacillus sp. DJP31 TaxID=3409789 RepID=UPI003BB7CACD
MELTRYQRVIEEKRNLMIQLGLKKGLLDSETIKVSQELDQLLNFIYKKHFKRSGNVSH